MKKVIILFGLALTFLLLVSCEDTVYGTSTYKYEVTGSATSVNITMSDSNGETSQMSNVAVPWSYSFNKDNIFDFFAYLSAQNNNGDNSTVTAKIYRNGKEVKSATSTGAYCIATVSYSW